MSKTLITIGGKKVELVEDNEDVFKRIIECPNCGSHVEYGTMRAISGYVGCGTKLENGKRCFAGDLQPRVLDLRKCFYEDYIMGNGIYKTDIEESWKERAGHKVSDYFCKERGCSYYQMGLCANHMGYCEDYKVALVMATHERNRAVNLINHWIQRDFIGTKRVGDNYTLLVQKEDIEKLQEEILEIE